MNESLVKQRDFREHLPNGCPPSSAQAIFKDKIVYRILGGERPEESDFASLRARNPTKRMKSRKRECEACGVSVWRTLESIRLLQSRHKKFRGKGIAQVRLDLEAGKIYQSKSNPDHFTWWPFASFEILNNCELVSS